MPSLGHNSNKTYKPGPILLEDTVYSESLWGNLSYVSEDGTDVHLKVPIETTNYGAIYDNLLEAIENKQPKIVKNEEVLAVLDIIEQGTIIAKEAVKWS